MSHLRALFWVVLAIVPALTTFVPPVHAVPDHQRFDLVLGQVRLQTRRANATDDRGLDNPVAVALDRTHSPVAVYVADQMNGRVLGWRDVTDARNGRPADLILGQPDANAAERLRTDASAIGSPSGLAVDKTGTLWVSDAANGRIVGFRWPFDPAQGQSDRVKADLLIGQTDFGAGFPDKACNGGPLPAAATAPGPASATTLCLPGGLFTDGDGNLYAADSRNHRVLFFRAPIAERNAAAVLVFGQDSLTGASLCNRSATPVAPDQKTLCNPSAVTFTARGGEPQRLFVVDSDNHRVLVYDDPQNSQSASAVLGQSSMSQGAAGGGADHFRTPAGVAVDGVGTVWVSEVGGHRVLGFSPPLPAAAAAANFIVGQPDANDGLANQGVANRPIPPPGAYTLYSPMGLAIDEADRLLVADSGNHRALIFPSPRTLSYATQVLGQADFAHGAENRAKAHSLAYPVGVAIDRPDPASRPGEALHIYVADFGNSRVLGWKDLAALKSGQPADVVLGQKNFQDASCNQGRGVDEYTLCWPRGVTVDKSGDVWVADTFNNRVLRYPRPFAQKPGTQSADLVLGQTSFLGGLNNINGLPTPTGQSLWAPVAVAVDGQGVVWVADRDNDRVVGYSAPYAIGMSASRVLVGLGLDENTPGCTARGNGGFVCSPSGLALDPDGNLWVADRDNNRVALYSTTPISPMSPMLSVKPIAVLGQPSLIATGPNNDVPAMPTNKSLWAPESVSLEMRVDNNGKNIAVAIVVADTGNHRVLVYEPITSGFQPEASAVIGQDGRYDRQTPNLSLTGYEAPANIEKGLWSPGAVVALPEGIFIADSGDTSGLSLKRAGLPAPSAAGNNRVLVIQGPTYPRPPETMDGGTVPDLRRAADLAPVPETPEGCSCQVGAAPLSALPSVVGLGLIVLGLLRRRRR